MHTIFVTGTDTGIGKTQVVAALARLLSRQGRRVQIVKAVETGRTGDEPGDAGCARSLAGTDAEAFTLLSFKAALAPLAAAAREGRELTLAKLQAGLDALSGCDWRIIEGAGGVAVPLTSDGRDWVDFARLLEPAPLVVLVAPNRLGAINQTRLAQAYAVARGLKPVVWLNACAPVEAAVSESNQAGLQALGLTPIASQAHGAWLPDHSEAVREALEARVVGAEDAPQLAGVDMGERCRQALAEREARGLRRVLRVTEDSNLTLNLANNDYLALAHDPAVAEASARAAREQGTSASASPLITGWKRAHASLLEALCEWQKFPRGLLWSSGYAANLSVLGVLPQRGDLVLADRLIHHSMIAGLLSSGARLKRYGHLRLDQLEAELVAAAGRRVLVVTESVFSMDGDYPDMRRLAALKRRFGFFWIVDEAHALGWYGPEGAGMVRAAGVEAEVDVVVGTLGKALASGGAYALFRDEAVRDQVMNHAGEFIYSTALPPPAAAAAEAAIARVRLLSAEQGQWQEGSRRFRSLLREAGWDVAEGDSPIVPVKLGAPDAAVGLAAALRATGVLVAAVRPPTVPEGTSRVRFSLKRGFGEGDFQRVLAAMQGWRARS